MIARKNQLLLGVAAATAMSAGMAQAYEFKIGEIEGSTSTQLQMGAQWSTQGPDKRYKYAGRRAGTYDAIFGPGGDPGSSGNGGTNPSPNEDDGRMNFGTGLISHQVKGRTDLDFSYGEFGTHTEFLYFYDFYLKDHQYKRTQPTGDQEDEIAADIRTLENYVYWEGDYQEMPVTVRLGDQTINWGESNLISGTTSFINPMDYNRLTSPTFDLEELYRPIGAVFGSIGLNERFDIEAYYQYDWEPASLPPGGSFYANTDYVGEGTNNSGVGHVCLDNTSATDENRDTFADTPSGFPAGIAQIVASSGDQDLCIDLNNRQSARQEGQHGVKLGIQLPELNETSLSLFYVKYHNRLPHLQVVKAGLVPVTSFESKNHPDVAQAAAAYEEDLEVFGASWSTNIVGGVAFSGEMALRKDYPLQINTTELFCGAGYGFATPPAGFGITQLGEYKTGPGETCEVANHLSSTIGQPMKSTDHRDVMQAQVSFIQNTPHLVGGSDLIALLEIGYQKVIDMPKPDELIFEADDVSKDVPAADDSGWGYRLLFFNEYQNLFPGKDIALKPLFIFMHDVKGNTVKNLASYKEGKKLIQAGVTAEIMSNYSVGISYRTFFGAKDRDMLSDRDTLSLTVGVEF